MNTTRLLGSLCAAILASSLGAIAACGGSHGSTEAATTAANVNAASVSIALMDDTGSEVGVGSGVMIAPSAVLTSAHLVAGKSSWVVTSADGKTKVTAKRAMTYDWMVYDSSKAHPRRSDVAVIYLDSPINLSSYPSIVGQKVADGAQAIRLRGTGAGFEPHTAALQSLAGAPNSYLVDGAKNETLDTGGAVYNDRGIVGIVSGRGLSTGMLYVARVDNLSAWLGSKIACAGGALSVRAYAEPAPKAPDCDASTPSPGDTGSPGSPGSPGTSSSSSSSGDDDSPGTPGGPGSSSGSPGDNGGPGSPGGPGSSSGSPGDNGGPGVPPCSGDSNGHCHGHDCGSGGPDDNHNPGDHGGPKGNNGVGNGIDGQPPGNPPINDGPGTGPGNPGNKQHGKDNDTCNGANDNPDVCPPEADNCSGPSCGGGHPDDDIDFGACSCHGHDKDDHPNLK